MAKRVGRPPKVKPIEADYPKGSKTVEAKIDDTTVATAVVEPLPEPEKITDTDQEFLDRVAIGVSGMTGDAKIIGGDHNKFVYRQSSDKKVDYNKSRGYEVCDKESILGPHSGSDARKHGDTLLMRCPRPLVEARNKLKLQMASERVERIERDNPRGPGIVGGTVNVNRRNTE